MGKISVHDTILVKIKREKNRNEVSNKFLNNDVVRGRLYFAACYKC